MSERDPEVVLIFAPSARDVDVAKRELAARGIESLACSDVAELCARIRAGVGAALISEELLEPEGVVRLERTLWQQPAWSDLPLLVASRRHARGPDSSAQLKRLGNVTLLDSPLRLRTLAQAVMTALRIRRRQYDARRAIERRDEFLAMLSHELRNPLSAIALAGELLEQKEGVSSPVLILRRQTRQLTRIVDDLLDVARVSTGKLELTREPLDLGKTLGEWVEAFRARFEEAGVTLALTVSDRAEVDADAARLEQVFGNLLANCLKYTPRGGKAEVHLWREAGSAVVAVEDDGIGITPDMLPRIFDQFVQIEESLDRAQGGMGVGLTLVRTLVTLHGGTVEAHSEGLGRGSRFIVRLPLSARASCARMALGPRSERGRSGGPSPSR